LNTAKSTHREGAAGLQDPSSVASVGRRGARALRRALACLAALLLAGPAAAAVEVVGVDGALTANVLAYLNLDEEPCDAPRWRIEQQYRAAPARIRDALQAFGYYEPSVTPALEFPADCWRAVFTIEAGQPVLIRGFDVQLSGEALGDAEFTGATEQSQLRSGAILRHGAYEELKRRWSDLARERGYPDARFVVNRIDVYPEQHVADMQLQFDSGARYTFGRTEFQQDVLTERLVRSYVPYREGEPYDGRRLTDLYVALADSGYFRNIDVRPLAGDAATRTIPIEIVLTAAARRQISYGVGFSTDTGPRHFGSHGQRPGAARQLARGVAELRRRHRA
jgi:translocation and assembly module TamA